jgi:hypothetical protein
MFTGCNLAMFGRRSGQLLGLDGERSKLADDPGKLPVDGRRQVEQAIGLQLLA